MTSVTILRPHPEKPTHAHAHEVVCMSTKRSSISLVHVHTFAEPRLIQTRHSYVPHGGSRAHVFLWRFFIILWRSSFLVAR